MLPRLLSASTMSQDRPDQEREVAVQREAARVALVGLTGFALAGSGAIREHGLIERPTEDVDLFTNSQDITEFRTAIDQVVAQLEESGFCVEQTRNAPQFARLHAVTADGLQLDVDVGEWCQTADLLRGTQARTRLRCRRRG